MTRFDTIIVVDWSGGNDRGKTPKKDAIWTAGETATGPLPPLYHRNRQVAEAWIDTQVRHALGRGERLFLGFDFPFGYPAGFAAALTGRADPLAVWAHYRDHLQDTPHANNRFDLAGQINARFPGVGPFWFNATRCDIAHLPHSGRARQGHGLPERRLCETRAKGSFTCWQMGGAGAVGSQAMTGQAALARLMDRHPGRLAVWPFHDWRQAPVVLVEVWPSLFADGIRAAMTPRAIKDAVQVAHCARLFRDWQDQGRLAAQLDSAPEASRTEEGWILGL